MEPRNAIVTGASHGIGAHIARALAARGMNLLLVVARSEGELGRLAGELRTRDTAVAVAAVDLAGRQAAQQVAEAARAELGGVDVLVNNAATEPQTRFHVLTSAEIEDVLQVDLLSPLLLSRLVLPGMLERGYGRIINVSSLAGHTSFPYTEAYAAAKDGLTAFSRVLTGDYRHRGVGDKPHPRPGQARRGHHPDPGRDRPGGQYGIFRLAGEGGRRGAARDQQAQARDGRQRRPGPDPQGPDGLLPWPGSGAQPAQRNDQADGRRGRLPGGAAGPGTARAQCPHSMT